MCLLSTSHRSVAGKWVCGVAMYVFMCGAGTVHVCACSGASYTALDSLCCENKTVTQN